MSIRWMNRSLALAKRALGNTFPNPLVGAIVLDKSGRKVGEGFHCQAGKDHAEVIALRQASARAVGGTLFCTLEPCNHTGRVGPCTEVIIKSGIKKVVVASLDINPLVSGQGLKKLRNAGLEIEVGLLSDSEASLNAPFRTWIKTKLPLVTAKLAISMDGFVGLKDERVLISSAISQQTTMKLRAEAQAIMIGVNTALVDDPLLNVRCSSYADRNPYKIVIDPTLRIQKSLRLFKNGAKVILVCLPDYEHSTNAVEFRSMGVTVLALGKHLEPRVDLFALISYLGNLNMTSVLIEGGPSTLSEFLALGLIDRWVIYRSPDILSEKYAIESLVKFDLPAGLLDRASRVVRRGIDEEFWIS